jgi:hypothetical protein
MTGASTPEPVLLSAKSRGTEKDAYYACAVALAVVAERGLFKGDPYGKSLNADDFSEDPIS